MRSINRGQYMYEPRYGRLLDWVRITDHEYEETRGGMTGGHTGPL